MKVNGVEFQFNATKLESLKKLEDNLTICTTEVQRGVEAMQRGLLYEGAKMQIDAFRQFFISVVEVDVVGECDDLAIATAIFEDFQHKIVIQRDKIKEEYFKRR